MSLSTNSYAASSTASSYDVSNSLGGATYGRTGSISSAHGSYMGAISGLAKIG